MKITTDNTVLKITEKVPFYNIANKLAHLPLGHLLLRYLPLGHLPLRNLPLGYLPLGHLPLRYLPLGHLPLKQLPLGLKKSNETFWVIFIGKIFRFKTAF